MISQKQKFKCKVCGLPFWERIPDCVTPEVAAFVLHPVCKLHRKKEIFSPKKGYGK